MNVNWIKLNRVFEVASTIALVLITVARIAHMVSIQTFLWSAVSLLLIGLLISNQTRIVLSNRIQELESGAGNGTVE